MTCRWWRFGALAAALVPLWACLPITPEQADALRAWQATVVASAVNRGEPCPQYAADVAWRQLPDHFLTVIWNESRCDPAAVNRGSGATGLTQIMPDVWLDTLCPMEIACTVEDLKDPARNLDAAAVVYDAQGPAAWSGW